MSEEKRDIVVNPRPKTEREQRREKIVEYVDNAERYLRKAGGLAKEAGDKAGSDRLSRRADEVKQDKESFGGDKGKV
jgi:hypothetical protein